MPPKWSRFSTPPTAESTLCVLDECGLRNNALACSHSYLVSGFCSWARVFAPRFLQIPPPNNALALRNNSPPSAWGKSFTSKLSYMLCTSKYLSTEPVALGIATPSKGADRAPKTKPPMQGNTYLVAWLQNWKPPDRIDTVFKHQEYRRTLPEM